MPVSSNAYPELTAAQLAELERIDAEGPDFDGDCHDGEPQPIKSTYATEFAAILCCF